MVDNQGRTITKLRLSLTDRCDMRCVYCMPAEGARFLPRPELLTFEEIERLARLAVGLGIRRIRLTGGEPLLRPGVAEIVARLRALPGLEDVTLTTNGRRLKELAEPLVAAGLRRVNVSLDSLDPEKFRRVTRGGDLHRVLEGLEAAERAGLCPIKVNVVALGDFTEEELLAFARLARRKPYQVRFIEFMPLDGGEAWRREAVLSGREILERIDARWALRPASPNGSSEPATLYRFADGRGEVGIIPTVTEPFCDRCNRIRLTADGKLRTCLFSETETDLRALLRNGRTDAQIAEVMAAAVALKEPGHRINEGDFRRPSRAMYTIGG